MIIRMLTALLIVASLTVPSYALLNSSASIGGTKSPEQIAESIARSLCGDCGRCTYVTSPEYHECFERIFLKYLKLMKIGIEKMR